MLNFLNKLFCNHEYEFIKNVYGDGINHFNGNRSIVKCRKCGKYKSDWKYIGSKYINNLITRINDSEIENISDKYHTFKELYDFRLVYNANLFNEWSNQEKYSVHKSKKHSDGELCFGGGWFIVMAQTPYGQISNHYENEYWDMFNCEERELADEWDGHTAKDVLKTLMELSKC